jgi:hypothetical protein
MVVLLATMSSFKCRSLSTFLAPFVGVSQLHFNDVFTPLIGVLMTSLNDVFTQFIINNTALLFDTVGRLSFL